MSYRNFNHIVVLFVVVILMIAGCGRGGQKGAVVAKIGDTTITIDELNERISHLPARYQDVIKKRKKEFLDEVINDTLLYHEAVRKGLHKDKDVLKVIEEAKKKILTARLLKDAVDDRIVITEDDIQEHYNANSDKYVTPELMRVSHILIPTRDEAKNILEKLNEGELFEDIARARSVDPTAQQGGDIGYFPRGQLMPEFENACIRLEVGQISGTVKTKLGYHVIKLTDRITPELRPLDQVKEPIKARLRTTKRQKLFNDLLSRLHEETVVEINEDILTEDVADKK